MLNKRWHLWWIFRRQLLFSALRSASLHLWCFLLSVKLTSCCCFVSLCVSSSLHVWTRPFMNPCRHTSASFGLWKKQKSAKFWNRSEPGCENVLECSVDFYGHGWSETLPALFFHFTLFTACYRTSGSGQSIRTGHRRTSSSTRAEICQMLTHSHTHTHTHTHW